MERDSLFLTATVLIMAIVAAAMAIDNSRAYPFKSAIITYRISGSIQQGTQTLYIDDHGTKTRTERETTMNVMGTKRKDSSLEIDDGNYHYRIDLMRKTGEKTPSYSKMAEEMVRTMSEDQKKDMEKLGKELAKGLTGREAVKPAGKGIVLGKECAVYDLMGVKSWLWNNLALKIKNPALGNMTQEAVELKVDVPIEPDKFKVPPDVKITEASGRPAGIQPPVR
ncbi:MAG: hypothetical protein NTX71_03505 [Candidatus Aureabacteria bacterium]|nr:hypothetical protein [Candidatus Auribacterota bacterium]